MPKLNMTFRPCVGVCLTLTLTLLLSGAMAVAPAIGQAAGGAASDGGLAFEPTSYDFGVQQVNSNAGQTTLQVRNADASPIQVNSLDIVGPNANSFWIGSSDCYGATLQPNATCSVQVWFGPSDTTAYAAQVRVATSDASFTADLTGEGGRAVISASPDLTDFGPAVVGSTDAIRTITLTNSGNVPASFFIAVIAAGDVGSFRLLDEDCTGHPLNPSESCAMHVRFEPWATGVKTARLGLFGDQSDGAGVTLTGVGTAFQPASSAGPRPPGIETFRRHRRRRPFGHNRCCGLREHRIAQPR